MSYNQGRRIRRVRRPHPAMGDFFADYWASVMSKPIAAAEAADNSACFVAANQSVAELENRRLDLARNWHPSGLYTRDQFNGLINLTLSMLRSASQAIDAAASEPLSPDARNNLAISRADIQRKMSASTLPNGQVGEYAPFLDAQRKANAEGIDILDAPGLYRWILNSMSVAGSAVVAANVVACQRPWWVNALNLFMVAFNALYAVARAIVGVVIKAGQTVLKIPDMISTLITIGKWGVLAGVGYWIYTGGPQKLLGR